MKHLTKNIRLLLLLTISLLTTLPAMAQRPTGRNSLRALSDEYLLTDDAIRVGTQVLVYQRITGGWPKNIDMVRPLRGEELAQVLAEKNRTDDSTIDNNATTMQLTFLARLYRATKKAEYRDAFRRGVEYLLSGQYANGGWPQFWPDPKGYQVHITYNDNAMANTLRLFRDMFEEKTPYDGDLIDKPLRKRLRHSFDKGIECILNTQIRVDGRPTVWCQQHDRETFEPTYARAYELPSYCSQESAALVQLLMELPKPDKRVKEAVRGAMQWFDTYKLTGLRYERGGRFKSEAPSGLVSDPDAAPLWARFYDLELCEPYYCDRDGIMRRRLDHIGTERRNGYAWFSTAPRQLYKSYDAWADKYDAKHKLAISLKTKGANENGTIQLERKPVAKPELFDAIVNPGQSIQAAIEKAPAQPTEPYKILIKKGTYNEKVIIDRPNIVLVGEDREQTTIVYAELHSKRSILEYKGQPVGNGVIVLQKEADDCVISGLTVYNNYGSTVEPTTAHQMAIFGRGTRTIVINCNIYADGNDALALWAKGGEGMYYHADLNLRCPGVDFLCPRGWCYVTRSKFYGDGRAIIWHDGRDHIDQKLVITDSEFDAKSPTVLGRYHHDSQFYLSNCHLSKNILDGNIHYAYSDKVLDPCPWGLRTYYYNCVREGGHTGWMKNNLHEAKGQPQYHTLTARWTFMGKWDPEKRIRDLWEVLAY